MEEKLRTEKQAFSQELGAISNEMNKLRNIQGLYLKEKEMNELLEHQMNKLTAQSRDNHQQSEYIQRHQFLIR